MDEEEKNKIPPFQKARLIIYVFFHLFTYKSYGKYLKGIRHAHALLEIAIVCLLITPLLGKQLSMLGLSLAYISMGAIIIVTLRGKPIEKSSKVLTQYFDLARAKLHLRVYDYAPYNPETKEAMILFNLFPETNNITMLFRLIKKRIKKEEISYNREVAKIKQIIKYMRNNPENKTNDKYLFFISLPDSEITDEIKNEIKKKHLNLKKVEILNRDQIRPINITSRYYTGGGKLSWSTYEIQ